MVCKDCTVCSPPTRNYVNDKKYCLNIFHEEFPFYYNRFTVKGTAASHVFFRIVA